MIYSTPSGVQVYVLKEYLKRREFFPVDWRMTYALNVLDCIQNLASGKAAAPAASDFEALENLRRLALAEQVLAPKQLELVLAELAEAS